MNIKTIGLVLVAVLAIIALGGIYAFYSGMYRMRRERTRLLEVIEGRFKSLDGRLSRLESEVTRQGIELEDQGIQLETRAYWED